MRKDILENFSFMFGSAWMGTERYPRWLKAHWVRVPTGSLFAMVVLIMPHAWVLGAEPGAILQVDYTAPTISIEAHQVSLQEVLVAMGEQVGFHVISIGEVNTPVRQFSLHNVSVEDALDTLLVGRSYGMSHYPASGQPGHGIAKVFVMGASESEREVTSRVGTMGEYYPSSTEAGLPTQHVPSSLTEFRDQAQEIFNQLREHEELNALYEQNLQDPLHKGASVAKQHQQDVEKARDLFDTLRQATQIERVNGGAEAPSHRDRSMSALDQELASFHEVLMEMTSQRQK